MWAQPWAWLGLAGLAVPIAIHLLARHQAVRAPFPTLRFISASELNAIKRQRLTDIPLMLVRLLMVALAVAAIAGPRFGSAPAATDEESARVTVYDMTASAASGRSDSFVEGPRLRRANVLADSLREGLAAASAWAVRQSGRREIAVVSDFQRGTLDDAAIQRVPKDIGLHFDRVTSTPPPLAPGLTVSGDQMRMAWPAEVAAPAKAIAVDAGSEQADADRMLAAVLSVTPLSSFAGPGSVTVIFPQASDRDARVTDMQPIDNAWMFSAVKDVLSRWPAKVSLGASKSHAGTLMVALDLEPSSLDAAEAVATIAAALAETVPASESDPRTIDDAQLKAWERPAERVVIERAGEPQGRWLWAAVLVLLAVETAMRRRAA